MWIWGIMFMQSSPRESLNLPRGSPWRSIGSEERGFTYLWESSWWSLSPFSRSGLSRFLSLSLSLSRSLWPSLSRSLSLWRSLSFSLSLSLSRPPSRSLSLSFSPSLHDRQRPDKGGAKASCLIEVGLSEAGWKVLLAKTHLENPIVVCTSQRGAKILLQAMSVLTCLFRAPLVLAQEEELECSLLPVQERQLRKRYMYAYCLLDKPSYERDKPANWIWQAPVAPDFQNNGML